MVVGRIAEEVDLLVVGGGPGGYTAALHAAAAGRAVTLVERGGAARLGGVCLHEGCIPSKALIEFAGRVRAARVPGSGLDFDVRVDIAAFSKTRDEGIERLRVGVDRLLAGAGVRLLAGHMRFTGPGTAVIELEGEAPPVWLEFRDVVLATGSRSLAPPGLEPDGERVLDARHALALADLPKSILVVGGGYIGLELGQALARLGTSVTLVEAADQVLPRLMPRLVRPVVRALEADGVRILTGCTVRDLDGGEALLATGGGEDERVLADRVLVAVGRQPNTDDLGLRRIGVETAPDGRLQVGPDRLAAPHVAAIGDITAGPGLAHKATAEARVAVDALCGRPAAFAPYAVPEIVFTDPEVATAGLTEEQAREEGLAVRTARIPFSASGRAVVLDRTSGFTELVADAGTGTVLGVHIVGAHAAELIFAGAHAIEMAATVEDLAGTIAPHPTLSEGLAEAALTLVRANRSKEPAPHPSIHPSSS